MNYCANCKCADCRATRRDRLTRSELQDSADTVKKARLKEEWFKHALLNVEAWLAHESGATYEVLGELNGVHPATMRSREMRFWQRARKAHERSFFDRSASTERLKQAGALVKSFDFGKLEEDFK